MTPLSNQGGNVDSGGDKCLSELVVAVLKEARGCSFLKSSSLDLVILDNVHLLLNLYFEERFRKGDSASITENPK